MNTNMTYAAASRVPVGRLLAESNPSASSQVLVSDLTASNKAVWRAIGVLGAGPSTDNALARYDGILGALQNSGVLLDDSNNLIMPSAALLEFINTNAKIKADSNGVLDIIATLLRLNFGNAGDVQMPGDGFNIIPFTDGQSGIGDLTTLGYLYVTLTGIVASYVVALRNTVANTAGNDMTVGCGGATSGYSNLNGGQLILRSGTATGTGSSGIDFYTAKAGGSGASDRTPDKTFAIGSTGLITEYGDVATVSNGVPAEYAQINTTGLTANVGAATLYAVPAGGAGLYRISAYVVLTTAASVSSTLPNVQIVYTDVDSNVAVTLNATPTLGAAGLGQTGVLTGNTAGLVSAGVVVVNAKLSTNIQYQTVNYASTIAGMTYAIHLRLEKL